MNDYYGSLAAEVYDTTKPIDGYYPDVPYYIQQLRKLKGRVLEAAVGTGRLLVPLLEAGIEVDGIDNSEEMLDHCRRNCAKRGLKPRLYTGTLQEMRIAEKYQAIVVSFGSFQIFDQREDALKILRNFTEHLVPGGKLYLDIDIPRFETHRAGLKVYGTAVPTLDGGEIHLEGSRTYNMVDQVESIVLRYEKWLNGSITKTEIQKIALRWYGKFEMLSLLREHGFSQLRVCGDYDLESEPSDENERMCFSGTWKASGK